MKIILSIVLALTSVISQAATWTFHASRDNYCYVDVMGNDFTREVWIEWDIVNGGGVWVWEAPDWNTVEHSTGFNETYTFDLADETFWGSMAISSLPPNYDGWQSPPILFLGGGEFWIDFDSAGVARISTTLPTDLGKWAWDGINQSQLRRAAIAFAT